MPIDWPATLSEQLEWHWDNQLRARLDGLTDDEYFWQPVPGCWTVRPVGDRWVPDWQWPEPDPPPVTTIGWRVCHLWMVLYERADHHFGGRTSRTETLPWPGESPATALAALDEAHRQWRDGVRSSTPADLERRSEGPPGTLDGRFPFAEVVLHVNREIIHHGAEVAVLRDLYRAGAATAWAASE